MWGVFISTAHLCVLCRLKCWAWKIFSSKVESSETCSDGPKQKASVSSALFFELFRLSMGCETFLQSWSWKWGIGLLSDPCQTDSLGQRVQVYSWVIQLISVIYLRSIIRLWRGVKQLRQLPSPQTGQTSPLTAGHMETLNRSSSTDFLLLLYSEHSLWLAWY